MTTTISADNGSVSGSAGLKMSSDSSGVLALQTGANSTAMTLDASGNVGIGTASPTNRLTVNGGTGSTPTIRLNGGTAADDNALISSKYNLVLGCNADGNIGSRAITFVNSTTENMRIDTSGNLLVGQTSQTGNEKFGVTQSAATSFAAYFNATAGNYGYDVVKIRCARGSATNEYNFINCLQVSTLVFQVQANGNVQNTNNSYGSLSDVKLKENIVDATPKLADLMQVKVRNYNLKSDPTHKQIGVIAQELEQVFPSMVEEATDKDEEGNSLGTTTKGVKYSVFVPMLIKSIQELKAINDTQAETINALTARIVALETA